MVATVGSISVDLAVKSAAFEAGFRRAGTTVERESARMSRATAAASRSIDGLSAVALRFGGALGGAFAGREIIRYADAWTEAGNKIRAAGEIAGRQGRGLRELNDIATETRSGLTETVDLYAKLLRATGDVAKSEAEVARATEIVNKAFKAGGAAASEQAAGILQLGQALGSGILQGDELRSLRENAPLLAQAIAKEFNTTVAGLKELGAAGELTSARVFKAILAGAGEIEGAFAKTEATIGDGLTRIKNVGTELIGTLSEVTGGAGSLAGELQTFASEMERMSDSISQFANNPSVRNFFEQLLGASIREGSLVDQIRDGIVGKDFAELERDIVAVTEEIAALQAAKEKLPDGDPSLSVFSIEISNAKQRLRELNAEVDALRTEADQAALAVGGLGDEINRLQDKTVTVTVKTNVPNVTSLGGVAPATIALTNPVKTSGTLSTVTPKSINVQDFLSGTRASGGPVQAGGTYLVGEEGPELVTMPGSGNVASASSTASLLSGGRDTLKQIEENTFQTHEEVLRAVGYLATLVDDGQAALTALRALENAIDGLGGMSSGGGFSSSVGGSVARSGGFSSGTSHYDFNDPSSPYYYNSRLAMVGGPQYDPLSDYLYNGNQDALNLIGSGFNRTDLLTTATSTNIAGNRQPTTADIQAAIAAGGTQVGTYGGGYNITAGDEGNITAAFFGTGYNRFPPAFASGGMIPPGDSDYVQFFKNPNEAVGIFRPEQMSAIGEAMSGANANVTLNYHAAPGNPDPSPRAMMELRDQVRQTVLAVMAGL